MIKGALPFFLSLSLHAATGASLVFVGDESLQASPTQIEVIQVDPSVAAPESPAPAPALEVVDSGELKREKKNLTPPPKQRQSLAQVFSPGQSAHPYFKKIWFRLNELNRGLSGSAQQERYRVRLTVDKRGRILERDIVGASTKTLDEIKYRLGLLLFLPAVPDDVAQQNIVIQYDILSAG